jgi:HlyD family secretion protein
MLAPVKQPLFRQAALNRIASPEMLDQQLVVTRPHSWIGLAALLLIVAVAVGWSVFGRLATYVSGTGLLINAGGHLEVATAIGSGEVHDLLVKEEDAVEDDQLLGHIEVPEAEQRLRQARELLAERQAELARQQAGADEEISAKRAALAARRVAIEVQRRGSLSEAAALRAKLADEEQLLRDNIVTRSAVLQTRTTLARAENAAADANSQIAQLVSQDQELVFQAEQRVRNATFQVADAQRRLDEANQAWQLATEIRAPLAGRIVQLDVNPGGLVSRGQPVVTIETPGNGVEMLVFLSRFDGGKVNRGMAARVSPSWTTRENEGSIRAMVSEVSRFPLTADAIQAIVHNDNMMREFSRTGPPILVRLRLQQDPTTVSGYAWTTARGSEMPLNAGGAASAEIQVKSEAPINLVIPALKRILHL